MVIILCLSNTAWYDGLCIINQNATACKYGVALGALGWLVCLPFIIADAVARFTLFRERFKKIDIADAAIAGLFALLWFTCFTFTASEYSQTNTAIFIETYRISLAGVDAALAFSFLSMVFWCALCAVSTRRAIRAHRNSAGKVRYAQFDDSDEPDGHETPANASTFNTNDEFEINNENVKISRT